jgi:hypothetical protein
VRIAALVVSSSIFRGIWYSHRQPDFGIDVQVANGGVECIERLRSGQHDVVILETSLLWGGSEGVLAIREEDPVMKAIPFVLVALDEIPPLTYELALKQLQSFLIRVPSIEELVTTVHLVQNGIYVHSVEDELWAQKAIAAD